MKKQLITLAMIFASTAQGQNNDLFNIKKMGQYNPDCKKGKPTKDGFFHYKSLPYARIGLTCNPQGQTSVLAICNLSSGAYNMIVSEIETELGKGSVPEENWRMWVNAKYANIFADGKCIHYTKKKGT